MPCGRIKWRGSSGWQRRPKRDWSRCDWLCASLWFASSRSSDCGGWTRRRWLQCLLRCAGNAWRPWNLVTLTFFRWMNLLHGDKTLKSAEVERWNWIGDMDRSVDGALDKTIRGTFFATLAADITQTFQHRRRFKWGRRNSFKSRRLSRFWPQLNESEQKEQLEGSDSKATCFSRGYKAPSANNREVTTWRKLWENRTEDGKYNPCKKINSPAGSVAAHLCEAWLHH